MGNSTSTESVMIQTSTSRKFMLQTHIDADGQFNMIKCYRKNNRLDCEKCFMNKDNILICETFDIIDTSTSESS